MYYVINDYYNLLRSKNSITMKDVVPKTYIQTEFYNNLLKGLVEGLIIFVNNKDNLKLLMLLNELDIPILVVSNYNLDNMGLKVVKTDELIDLVFRKEDQKVTRPFLIDIVELSIIEIIKELKIKDNIKRFVSIQILYGNPYFDYLITDNIKNIITDLDKKLNNSSKNIIDETLNYFLEHSFDIK